MAFCLFFLLVFNLLNYEYPYMQGIHYCQVHQSKQAFFFCNLKSWSHLFSHVLLHVGIQGLHHLALIRLPQGIHCWISSYGFFHWWECLPQSNSSQPSGATIKWVQSPVATGCYRSSPVRASFTTRAPLPWVSTLQVMKKKKLSHFTAVEWGAGSCFVWLWPNYEHWWGELVVSTQDVWEGKTTEMFHCLTHMDRCLL